MKIVKMKKIAIIGASYLQAPLIMKAKQLGIETHVFAWAANDVGERLADFFYPISITEKELILEKCQSLKISGVCSIGSDLAVPTVSYIAEKLGLISNSVESSIKSTNKHKMRESFRNNNIPSPKSIFIKDINSIKDLVLDYPVIVKPTDRSGSRGVTKIYEEDELHEAINYAINCSFQKTAVIEEFIKGEEYSVECISWKGIHKLLSITKKYTTGSPYFVECAHLQPASINSTQHENIKRIVFDALDSLNICYGASHTEFKINEHNDIIIIEVGARMGGDLIGSSLVELTTGFDYTKAVIEIALGIMPKVCIYRQGYAAIRYILDKEDLKLLDMIKRKNINCLLIEDIWSKEKRNIKDSSSRLGFFVLCSNQVDDIEKYMPKVCSD